jgi:hypothetical protein
VISVLKMAITRGGGASGGRGGSRGGQGDGSRGVHIGSQGSVRRPDPEEEGIE